MSLALAFCLIIGMCPTAFASSETDPYGFYYDEASLGRTMYEYYVYDRREDSHIIAKTFYSIGNSVYTGNGDLVTSTSAGSGALYNGFATNGDFYFITSSGSLIRVDSAGRQSVQYSSGAISLSYTSDDLAEIVQTTSGNKYLSNLSGAPSGTPGTPGNNNNNKPGSKTSRVEMYTNTSGEMVRDAYELGNLKVSIVVSKDGKSVLNATYGVRLSDTLKGAKFLGFDTSYNVYLYEKNGTLYRFTFGNWYSAECVRLDSKFKTFRTDQNGFISTIITEKSSYTIGQLTDTVNNKWVAKETYAVVKDTYTTLYTKGSVESNTLMWDDGNLYLNGIVVAPKIVAGLITSNIGDFGFISDKEFCYIRENMVFICSIYDRPEDGWCYCTDAKSLRTNDVGLVSQVVLRNGSILNIR